MAQERTNLWHHFEYDAAGRLVKVTADDGAGASGATVQRIVYRATNQRLIVTDGDDSSTSRTYYAGSSAEYTEGAAGTNSIRWTKSYIYLGDNLLSTITPNGAGGEQIEHHHPDRLGTRIITNPQTGTHYEQVTLPFGTALNSESSGAINRRFTSYDRSQTTGLDYAQNRHYDSSQGRFTTVDPIGMEATSLTDPQTLNLYSYCGNDPINHIDPDGLFFKKLFNFLKKAFQWIAVALTVAVAVLTIVYAPVLFTSTLKLVSGVIGAVANAASSVLNALGLPKAGAIFGIIAASASFGTSLLAARDAPNWKTILSAVSSGATTASRTLSAFGHRKVAQILGLVASTTEFISAGLQVKNDNVKGNVYSFSRSAFQVLKFARSTAQQVANISGATRVAGIPIRSDCSMMSAISMKVSTTSTWAEAKTSMPLFPGWTSSEIACAS